MRCRLIPGAVLCLLLLIVPAVLAGNTLTVTGTVVGEVLPLANFTADPTDGPAPLFVQFIDCSENVQTAYHWDFDSDGTIDSTEQHPSWTYTAPGTYTVTLTVINGIGQDTLVREDYITVNGKDAGERIDDLIGDVNGLKIPPGIKNVLRSELSLARWAYDAGNPDWCAYYMKLFTRTVTLLRGKVIPVAEADSLAEEALEILFLLQ